MKEAKVKFLLQITVYSFIYIFFLHSTRKKNKNYNYQEKYLLKFEKNKNMYH